MDNCKETTRDMDHGLWLESLRLDTKPRKWLGLSICNGCPSLARHKGEPGHQPCRAIPSVVRSIQTSVALDERELAPDSSCNSDRASAKRTQVS